jgi:hypothetical protein
MGEVSPCDCEQNARGRPEDNATFTRTGQELHQGWGTYSLRCRRCGQDWIVTEDTSYHFPTYTWEKHCPEG